MFDRRFDGTSELMDTHLKWGHNQSTVRIRIKD